MSPFLAGFAWRMHAVQSWFTGLEPGISKETARYTQFDYHYSNAKVMNAVDHKLRDIESGIGGLCKVSEPKVNCHAPRSFHCLMDYEKTLAFN